MRRIAAHIRSERYRVNITLKKGKVRSVRIVNDKPRTYIVADLGKRRDIRDPPRIIGRSNIQRRIFRPAHGSADCFGPYPARKYASAVLGHYPLDLYPEQSSRVKKCPVDISHSVNSSPLLLHYGKHSLNAES
mgnify:CR=1 FL=1